MTTTLTFLSGLLAGYIIRAVKARLNRPTTSVTDRRIIDRYQALDEKNNATIEEQRALINKLIDGRIDDNLLNAKLTVQVADLQMQRERTLAVLN